MKPKRMTSRERVQLAIHLQEPDRVPFDLSMTVDVYHNLRAYLGLPPDPDKKVGIWSEVTPQIDLLDAMEVDILYLGLNPSSKNPFQDQKDGLLYDQWGVGRTQVSLPNGSFYYEMAKNPLSGATLKDLEAYPWPDPYDPARVDGVREKFLNARKTTDKAIAAKFVTSIWEQSTYLCGMQNWLEWLVLKPEIVNAVLDKVTDIAIGLAEVGIREAGDLIDVFRFSGEDLGTQRAPLISPRMFNHFVRPRYQRFWSFVKEKLDMVNPQAKTLLHSCGAVRPYIPAWIEMGLGILDPIQPQAVGMEPEGLKRDFGRQLVFHGGIDLQDLLPNGTPEQVMAEVRRYIQALAPGGGYIVAPAHNVQSDVPPQNLVAIRDAIREYGCYPIQ